MDSAEDTLWPYLWEGAQDLSALVTSDFQRKDKEGLRGASSAARTAANALVSKVQITKTDDLLDLPQLRLHERFPRLASVALDSHAERAVAIPISRFTRETLAQLPQLSTVDLSCCKVLDIEAACAALVQCSQLQELSLPSGAHWPHAALGAVARLTGLTHLTMKHTKRLDVQGLKQLSSLKQLQYLDLTGGNDVTDEAVACLAQLSSLAVLDLWACHPFEGTTMGRLAAISSLQVLYMCDTYLSTLQGLELLTALQELKLPELELWPADLAPLSALTALSSIEAFSADITDECSALLRLPSLQFLMVSSFSLAAPHNTTGVLQQLTNLVVFSSGSLPRLLPLPKLQELHIHMVQDSSEEAEEVAALAAAISRQTSLTRLVLQTAAGEGLPEQQMQQMVAPLKSLQRFRAGFHSGETSCLAACAALAELPLLRELKLERVPQPAHLAVLVRCKQLEELQVDWAQGVKHVGTGLAAALACKPGMRVAHFPRRGDASSDDQQALEQLAARFGVQLGWRR